MAVIVRVPDGGYCEYLMAVIVRVPDGGYCEST